MKNKSAEETVNFIDLDRRRFLERAGGAVAGSLILPSLATAETSSWNKPIKALADLRSRVSPGWKPV